MESLERPKRRLRDRLVDRDGTSNHTLTGRHALANQLLLVDDDLREAALAMAKVESFLASSLDLLDDEQVRATDLARLAESSDALESLDVLSETISSLKKRLLCLASQID